MANSHVGDANRARQAPRGAIGQRPEVVVSFRTYLVSRTPPQARGGRPNVDRAVVAALWPSAEASQLLPTLVGPHRTKFSSASIQAPSRLEQCAVGAARGAIIDISDRGLMATWQSAGAVVCRAVVPSEVKKLRRLEEENTPLRRVVADLALDKEMLQEVIRRRNYDACRGREMTDFVRALFDCRSPEPAEPFRHAARPNYRSRRTEQAP
jgi:hypothetical protein